MPFPHEAHISTAAQQFRNAISIHVIIISGPLYQPIHSGCAVVPGKSKGNDFLASENDVQKGPIYRSLVTELSVGVG